MALVLYKVLAAPAQLEVLAMLAPIEILMAALEVLALLVPLETLLATLAWVHVTAVDRNGNEGASSTSYSPPFSSSFTEEAKCRISLGKKGHMSLLIDSPTNNALRWSI